MIEVLIERTIENDIAIYEAKIIFNAVIKNTIKEEVQSNLNIEEIVKGKLSHLLYHHIKELDIKNIRCRIVDKESDLTQLDKLYQENLYLRKQIKKLEKNVT